MYTCNSTSLKLRPLQSRHVIGSFTNSLHDRVAMHREGLRLQKLLHEEPVPRIEGLHEGLFEQQGHPLRRLHIRDGILVEVSTYPPEMVLQYLHMKRRESQQQLVPSAI